MTQPTPSPLNLDSEFLKARMTRFAERYDALVAETGMMLLPVLQYGPQGIVPNFMIVEKKPKPQGEGEPEGEKPAEEALAQEPAAEGKPEEPASPS